MRVIWDNGEEIWVELSSGERTVISKQDEWIIKEFPCWVIAGSRSKYVAAERTVVTEYSSLRERVYLHRLIMKLGPGNKTNVDHKDRDRLNNRRNNLRVCSSRQNMANVAAYAGRRFKGVHFTGKKRILSKPFASWIAYIDAKNGGLKKRRYLGHFQTEELAARAYDVAAREVWGEFAYQNFPNE